MAPPPSKILASISEQVRFGKSNAELIAAHPAVRPRTVQVYAALSRRRLGIPKSAPSTMGAVIFADVLQGFSNSDLIAAYPQFNPNSLSVIASRIRTENGIGGYSDVVHLRMPKYLVSAFATEAQSRGGYRSANDLALRVLALIVRDNMFDAILDEGK